MARTRARTQRRRRAITGVLSWHPLSWIGAGLPTAHFYNRRALRRLTASGGGFAAALYARDVLAHGFGERYELPLPLILFLSASGLVVLLSFAAMPLFLGQAADFGSYP